MDIKNCNFSSDDMSDSVKKEGNGYRGKGGEPKWALGILNMLINQVLPIYEYQLLSNMSDVSTINCCAAVRD